MKIMKKRLWPRRWRRLKLRLRSSWPLPTPFGIGSELVSRAEVDPTTSAGLTQKLDQVIAYKDDIVGQLQATFSRLLEAF